MGDYSNLLDCFPSFVSNTQKGEICHYLTENIQDEDDRKFILLSILSNIDKDKDIYEQHKYWIDYFLNINISNSKKIVNNVQTQIAECYSNSLNKINDIVNLLDTDYKYQYSISLLHDRLKYIESFDRLQSNLSSPVKLLYYKTLKASINDIIYEKDKIKNTDKNIEFNEYFNILREIIHFISDLRMRIKYPGYKFSVMIKKETQDTQIEAYIKAIQFMTPDNSVNYTTSISLGLGSVTLALGAMPVKGVSVIF